MEIIEIQCGSCNEMMAISVEHLDTQVHCPHCQAIVQAPPREALSTAPTAAHEQESIFTEPEQDDLFGSDNSPKVELPKSQPEPKPEPAPVANVPNLSLDKPAEAPSHAMTAHAPGASATATHEAEPAHNLRLGEGDEPPMSPSLARVSRKRSMLLPSLLIFLVPYSIVATIFVVMLMMNRTNPAESFEKMPDPEPAPGKDKKGPPRKITRLDHMEALPASLITRLKQPLTLGDIEFTPLEVRKTLAGNLALRFRVKNLSKDYAFVPISKAFLDMPLPYTYVHTRDLKTRVYGGFLEYQNAKGEPELKSSGELLPEHAETVQITTTRKLPDPLLKEITEARDKLLWRVQLRRGPIELGGKAYSATAVFGVEFNKGDIKPEVAPPPDFDDA